MNNKVRVLGIRERITSVRYDGSIDRFDKYCLWRVLAVSFHEVGGKWGSCNFGEFNSA